MNWKNAVFVGIICVLLVSTIVFGVLGIIEYQTAECVNEGYLTKKRVEYDVGLGGTTYVIEINNTSEYPVENYDVAQVGDYVEVWKS